MGAGEGEGEGGKEEVVPAASWMRASLMGFFRRGAAILVIIDPVCMQRQSFVNGFYDRGGAKIRLCVEDDV